MKRLPVFMFLLHGLTCLCQNSYRLVISGHVTEKDTNMKIKHALVHLRSDNGYMLERSTDSNGYYHFDFKKIKFNKAEISVMVDRQTAPVYKDWKYDYQATTDKALFETKDSARAYVKNFVLEKISGYCGLFYYPMLNFKKNSTDYVLENRINAMTDTGYYTEPAFGIQVMKQIVQGGEGIILEIAAYCSTDEKNAEQLSQQRAEKIKQELVKADIAPDRMIAKGYGTGKLLIATDSIRKGLPHLLKKNVFRQRTADACLK